MGTPMVTNYYIDSNNNLIVEYDNGTTQDLGEYGEDIIDSLGTVTISDDGYYVINGIKTEILAKTVTGYSVNSDGHIVVSYSDGTAEDLGALGESAANGIETITISEDGYYVINGVKTEVYALDNIETITISEDGYYVVNGIETTIFAINVYTVTFNTGFNYSVSSQKVQDGKTVSEPHIERTGYTLDGWYLGTEQWRFISDVVTKNIALSARWTANAYDLTFDTEGKFAVDGITVTYDAEYTLPTLEKTGHTFLGWSYNGEIVDNAVWKIASDVTLEDEWRANTYVITLDANGGNVSASTVTVTYGESYILPIPTNDFGVFRGWYYGDVKLTDETGASLFDWAYPQAITVTTSWIVDIDSADELADIADSLNGHYRLTGDINLNGIDWSPIGSESNPFTGILDGNGHTISNLSVTGYKRLSGLFGACSNQTIKNLTLSNVAISITNVTAQIFVGSLVALETGTESSISNIITSGLITIASHSSTITSCAGGVIGYATCPSLEDLSNDVSVSSATYVGGIAGISSGSSYCGLYNSGTISSTKYAGGLFSSITNAAIIKESSNAGSVVAVESAGGLIASGRTITVDECFNSGAVTCTGTSSNQYTAAGLVSGTYFCAPTINNSYNTGAITSPGMAGGIVGYIASDVHITHCYNSGKVDGDYYSGGILPFALSNVSITESINHGNVTGNAMKSTLAHAQMGNNVSIDSSYYSCSTSGLTDTSGIFTTEKYSSVFYVDTLFWDDEIWSFSDSSYPTLAWESAE
jgi:flagellar basal body rod protein FlgG